MRRIDSVDPSLRARLEQATPAQQRTAAAAAALLATAATDLTGDLIDAASAVLQEGRVDASLREQLEDLAEALDDEGFDLQEPADRGQTRQGQHELVFARARAASALCLAMHDDPEEAAVEGLYEAYAASGDIDAVRRAVELSLPEAPVAARGRPKIADGDCAATDH